MFMFFFEPFFYKKTWKWLTNMVGFWNLGLKMIPNDRPRSSLGSPGDFGQTNPKQTLKNPHFRETKNPKKSWKNHDFSKDFYTNGWGPCSLCYEIFGATWGYIWSREFLPPGYLYIFYLSNRRLGLTTSCSKGRKVMLPKPNLIFWPKWNKTPIKYFFLPTSPRVINRLRSSLYCRM